MISEGRGGPPHLRGSVPEGKLAGLSPGASTGPAPDRAGVSLGTLERPHWPVLSLPEAWGVGL